MLSISVQMPNSVKASQKAAKLLQSNLNISNMADLTMNFEHNLLQGVSYCCDS